MKSLLCKPVFALVLIFGILLLQGIVFDKNTAIQDPSEQVQEIADKQGPFADPDWEAMFQSRTPLLEIFLRGTITYLTLFFLLRLFMKRQSGSLGVTDLLVVVLLADAAQNAMADDYVSITDGIVLVTTIIFWAYFLDLLGYFFPWIQKTIHPPELLLVKDGKMIEENLQKELITEQELMGQLRESGIDSLENVQEAYMESDGRISVLSSTKSTKKKDRGKSF